MPLAAGTRLGPYEIVAAIGEGGMGEVYRARDPRLNRDVAIKVLTRAGHDAARQRRLTEEARAASALNHPNIVTVYDVGVQDEVPFIVSELVDGKSLRTLLARGPLPVREVLDLTIQMAEGLCAAHQAGIVHRDFKPDNVMVTREGRVKILDFGLALVGTQEGVTDAESTMTESSGIVGTVPYMSPEQARGAAVTYRTDQFSFGLTLYEMVAGQRAFKAETAAQTLTRIIEDEPEPIAKLNPRVPAPLRWVIERCLTKDARQRYEATADLARELRTLRDKLPEFAPPSEVVTATPRRWGRAAAVLAGAVAVTAAVAAVAGALWALTGPETGVQLEAYRFTPFAVDPGYQMSPAWSPNGKTIAYVAEVDGILQVFTKAVDAPGRNQVTHRQFDCLQPFWGSDTRLYFISQYQDRLGLYAVSSVGGVDPDPVLDNVTRAAMSADGKILALWRAVDNDYAGAYTLWLASPVDAEPARYTRGPFGSARLIEGRLQFSPDGLKLGVLTGDASDALAFWMIPLRGGEPRSLSITARLNLAFLGGFSWLPDGRHVLGASPFPPPGRHLWLLDTETAEARLVLASGGIESDPAVSSDGQRIAASIQEVNYDVYRVSTDRPRLEPVLASATQEMDPAWSPSISKMAVTTNRSGQEEIWLSSQNGELERRLVGAESFPEHTALLSSSAFSPDGQRLAYFRRGRGVGGIYISPVAGGPASMLVPESKAEQDMPSWSTDGWIAYAHQSETASGSWSLSKKRVGAQTPPSPLAENIVPNSPVRWAPNDAWIAFNGQQGLSVVSPDGKPTRTVSEQTWFAFAWSDNHHLVGIRQSDDLTHLTLTSVDVGTGVEKVLAANLLRLPIANQPVRGFARVSATTFLVSTPRVRSEIWLLDGFDPFGGGAWERLIRRFRPSTR